MTDPKPDPCRVMAEILWPIINSGPAPYSYEGEDGENGRHIAYIRLIEDAIRNHTIVPEMVELCHYAAKIKEYGQLTHLIARAEAILAKGRK